jgi:hypothetical protein
VREKTRPTAGFFLPERLRPPLAPRHIKPRKLLDDRVWQQLAQVVQTMYGPTPGRPHTSWMADVNGGAPGTLADQRESQRTESGPATLSQPCCLSNKTRHAAGLVETFICRKLPPDQATLATE